MTIYDVESDWNFLYLFIGDMKLILRWPNQDLLFFLISSTGYYYFFFFFFFFCPNCFFFGWTNGCCTRGSLLSVEERVTAYWNSDSRQYFFPLKKKNKTESQGTNKKGRERFLTCIFFLFSQHGRFSHGAHLTERWETKSPALLPPPLFSLIFFLYLTTSLLTVSFHSTNKTHIHKRQNEEKAANICPHLIPDTNWRYPSWFIQKRTRSPIDFHSSLFESWDGWSLSILVVAIDVRFPFFFPSGPDFLSFSLSHRVRLPYPAIGRFNIPKLTGCWFALRPGNTQKIWID